MTKMNRDIAEKLANLPAEKRLLLFQKLEEQSRQLQPAGARIPRREGRNDPCPLSFAQQRLWFVDQLEPGSTAYNMFNAVRLHGLLDVSALEQGYQQIVQRHEALRTTFQAVDGGQPQQIIVPSLALSLPVIDLSALPKPTQESEIQRLIKEEAQRPFDLAKGPLVRCSLLRVSDTEHILLLSMHHIVSDGWSMGVLFREIVLLGQSYAAGLPNPLPDLPLQYADFAIWQRNWLQGDVLETQLRYWKQQLGGAPAALELPGDHARPTVQTSRGARLQVSLPLELSDALQALSHQEDATLFMTLLGAFQVLLARYSGQTDIVVGSPIANRSHAELEGLIGFFANTLVLRTDLSGNPTFREVLRRVRAVCLGAYDHQDLPFEKLVDEMSATRDLSRNPLFQVMFILQNAPPGNPDVAGLVIEPLDVQPDTSKFDLRLSLQETSAGLTGILEYSTDLFEQQTIERMLEDFQGLLAGIVADPDQRLALGGKTGREVLPEPQQKDSLEMAYVAPRTPVEQSVTDIWKKILKTEKISVYDNFFDLGGDSLLATQVASRLRKTFQVEFPLRTMFQLQTVAMLAEWIETAQGQKTTQASPIVPASRNGPLPLSFGQQRLWFLYQLEPANTAYNIFSAVHISGALDVTALEQGFNEVVRRHEALRTTFKTVEGQPRQIVAASAQVHLPVVDLSALPQENQEPEIQRLAREEAQRPFDLSGGPLVRCSLLRLPNTVPQAVSLREKHRDDVGKTEHVLLLTMHHIISDGWSLGVLFREIVELGQAFAAGQPAPYPELSIQYADYAIWQREWLQGEVLTAQLDYWKEKLHGAPALLELPTDRSRPALQTYQGATQTFHLSPELTRALQALSQQEDVTLFMTLLAAFQALLARYSGQTDIVVGSPIANRNRAEVEGLIGLFINTLVLRTDLSGNPSFREVLQRVREVTLGAYDHQDLPFEKLVEELRPERDLSYNPLFQVMFILQNRQGPPVEIPGLALTALETDQGRSQFDLSISIQETPQGLSGRLEYNTGLFDAATITRMLAHFQILLEAITTRPETRLGALPLLPESERRQVLEEWNDTAKAISEVYMPRLLEKHASERAGNVAVIFEGTQLTYAELNQRVNRLAHYLRGLGVGPDVLVGIHLERSLEMLIGLLGILKAGGAYVPLDPSFPAERLAYMLEDASPHAVLTQAGLAGNLPQTEGRIVCLDTEWEKIEQQKAVNPEVLVGGENLAYVIYTSGSTGKPKGVQLSHLALMNFLESMQAQPGIKKEDTLLSVTTISFDIAGLELYLPLCVGAKVVIANRETVRDGLLLGRLLADADVTLMQATPATWRLMLDSGWQGKADLRVLCGGEAFPEELAWELINKTAEVWNMYGPTETTVWSTLEAVRELPITLGRPIGNTRIYVLDPNGQPVPIGIPGEIHIGGAGLARGYRGRPELTAEKFIPDPFADKPATVNRLYRTGDLGRYLPDGRLEFLGRIDTQVKVRGYRIELGEIEAVLRDQPGVKEAVVVTWQASPEDEARLAAYVVMENGSEDGARELRNGLKTRLPGYMLPSALMFLEQFPLTPNGKIDRKALPAPTNEQASQDVPYVAPGTPVEEQLATIWKEILKIEKIGIHENFFEAGGDSLMVMRVAARAHAAGMHFSPQDFFQHQTIAELALQAASAITQAEQNVPAGPLPLTVAQRGFFSEAALYPNHWNQTRLIEVPPGVDPGVMEQIVQYLWNYHDALRTRFVYTDDGWRQIIPAAAENTPVPFSYHDFSNLPASEHTEAIERTAEELQRSLNILEGPLMRVGLFSLGADRPGRLLVILHHLVYDATSSIFFDDFYTLTQQASRGAPASLPPKTASIRQWLERLDTYTHSPELHEERDYWLSLPWEEIQPLPVDFPENRENNTWASAHSLPARLSPEETTVLVREIPKACGVQLIDILITALVESTTAWSHQRWSMFSMVDFGRSAIPNAADLDLSRTVGWFAIDRRLVLQRDDNCQPEAALKSIRAQLHNMPNRGLGYELLLYGNQDKEAVETLQRFRKSEIAFNYLGRQSRSTKFREAYEYPGPACDPRNQRPHLLDCSVSILEGRLVTNWRYSKNIHKQDTVKKVAEGYIHWLQTLVAGYGMTSKESI